MKGMIVLLLFLTTKNVLSCVQSCGRCPAGQVCSTYVDHHGFLCKKCITKFGTPRFVNYSKNLILNTSALGAGEQFLLKNVLSFPMNANL